MIKINFFFFQAEDGIRDIGVTGVQTCALPISGLAGKVCRCTGCHLERSELRLRSQAMERHRSSAARSDCGAPQTVPRLASTERQTRRTTQNTPLEQYPRIYRRDASTEQPY